MHPKLQKLQHPFVLGLAGGIIGGMLSVVTFGVVFQSNLDKIVKSISQSTFAANPISAIPFLFENKNNKSPDTSVTKAVTVKSTSNDVSDVVEKVNPAVVSIVISKDVPVMEQYYVNPFGEGSPFQFQVPQYRQNGTQKQEVGGGSGFLISSDGYIVSNAHVINDPTAEYTVYLNGGKKYTASVVTTDETFDLALIKIQDTQLPYVEFGNSDQVKLGQGVIAIGNALGEFRNTVSTGVISGLARSITAGNGTSFVENLDNLIQTDAAINPGNSGGPLIDQTGHVIGVNVAIAQGSENIGFAIPSNVVKDAVDSMRKNRKVIHPFLGVRYVPINEQMKKNNKLSVDYGVLVVRGKNPEDLAVIPGSPANKAGIVEYDIILEADGKKITDTESLSSIMKTKKVGDHLKLKILHNGEDKTVEVVLDAK